MKRPSVCGSSQADTATPKENKYQPSHSFLCAETCQQRNCMSRSFSLVIVPTMSDASFATSVPDMPIAIPMSALFRAGASFTPSPVMATTCTRVGTGGLSVGSIWFRTATDHQPTDESPAAFLFLHFPLYLPFVHRATRTFFVIEQEAAPNGDLKLSMHHPFGRSNYQSTFGRSVKKTGSASDNAFRLSSFRVHS